MHWMSILTALTLALASAGLVFVFGWEPYLAFGVVGAAAVLLIVSLLLGLIAIFPHAARRELLDEVTRTIQDDFQNLLKLIRFKN